MDFLSRRWGDLISTPLQDPTSSEARDQPASQAAGNRTADLRVTVTDEEKWKASMARWRPEVKPSDADFTEKKADFERDLSGLSIDDVLRKHFSRFEIRKLNAYADKKREPHLYVTQREDADAYKALLQTEAWRIEREHASLSTKLTMAYFGLPVEPLTMSDLFPGLKPGFFTDGDDHDAVSGADDGMFVPEDKRPLRFLNNYDKRGWGKDNSHMMPNHTFEGYYRLPWIPPNNEHAPAHALSHGYRARGHQQTWDPYVPGLRGGGMVSEDEGSLIGDDIDDDASIGSDTPMEEDAQCTTCSNHDYGLSLRGGAGPLESRKAASLYGFLGRQVFEVGKVQAFFAAVDLLLALEDRRDSTGGGIPLTVAFLVANNDKDERIGVCKQIVRGQIGQSPQREQVFHDEVLRVRSDIMSTLTDNTSKVILFVCYQYQDRRFREGQGKQVTFQPSLQGDNCIRFSFLSEQDASSEESPAAYLWMPPNVWEGTSSHLYEEWFRAVLHASSYHYDDPENSVGRIKALQLQPFFVNIGIFDFPSQTPLPREAWTWLVKQFKRGIRRLSVTREAPSEFATYSVPGYAVYLSGPEQDDVFDLAWRSIPQGDRATVVRIDVKPWDVPFHATNPELASFTVQGGDVLKDGDLYRENSYRLENLLGQSRSLIVQPRWKSYRVHIVHDSRELATLSIDLDSLIHDWPQALKLIRDEFEEANRWRDNAVVHIDQGNPLKYNRVKPAVSDSQTTLEYQLRNRTAWDFEPEVSNEMHNLWQKFVHLVSFNDLEVSLVRKANQYGKPDIGNPLGLKTLDPERYAWGYNAPQFVRLQEPAVTGLADIPTGYNPIRPAGRQTQHEQETRAMGFEPPEIEHGDLYDIGSARVPFQRDQLPGRQPLDLAQRGKVFREWSYGSPLSINMKNQHPKIPINAPPLEQLFKQRGPNGLASTSLPVMSTQILTPTEQRRLQESYFRMRSIALNRGQLCPHKGCRAYFPVDSGNMDKFYAHLEQKHVGSHCPFCPETLFAHWPPTQRQRHFVDKHSEFFTSKGDILKEARLAESIENRGLVHRREEQYSFCPRCGRNHNVLNSKADRTQHDNVCFPGNTDRDANRKYCIYCGDPDFTGSGAPNDPYVAHDCQLRHGAGATPASEVFCKNCSLPCNELGASYARRHLLHCKSPDTGRDNWCPWCGIDLKSGSLGGRLQHLKDCRLKPFTGENPVCTETGNVMESPRDNPEDLRRSFFKPTPAEGYDRVVIPDVCPIIGCSQDLSLLNAHGLYTHFKRSHTEGTNAMTHCPFCQVDFVTRRWTIRAEKEAHLQDHIDRRYERIIADETISKSEDWESQEVRDAFTRRDRQYLAPASRLAETQRETVALTGEKNRLPRENQPLWQAAEQESGTSSPGAGSRGQQRQQPVVTPPVTPTKVPVPSRWNVEASRLPPAARRLPLPDTTVPVPTGRSPMTPASTQKATPGPGAGPARAQQTPARTPAQRPQTDGRTVGRGDYSDETGLSSRPSDSRRRRNRTSGDAPEEDGLYRPDRRASDGGDDDYREGLVPEPNPDLEITMVVTPAHSPPAGWTQQQAGTRVQDRNHLAVPGTTYHQPSPAAGSTRDNGQKRLSAATSKPAKRQRTVSEEASGPRTPAGHAIRPASPGPPALGKSTQRRMRNVGAPATKTIVGH